MVDQPLELDLDVFQGPFDLLLSLILREELELAEIPIAEIVVAFVERMHERGDILPSAVAELRLGHLPLPARVFVEPERGVKLRFNRSGRKQRSESFDDEWAGA